MSTGVGSSVSFWASWLAERDVLPTTPPQTTSREEDVARALHVTQPYGKIPALVRTRTEHRPVFLGRIHRPCEDPRSRYWIRGSVGPIWPLLIRFLVSSSCDRESARGGVGGVFRVLWVRAETEAESGRVRRVRRQENAVKAEGGERRRGEAIAVDRWARPNAFCTLPAGVIERIAPRVSIWSRPKFRESGEEHPTTCAGRPGRPWSSPEP